MLTPSNWNHGKHLWIKCNRCVRFASEVCIAQCYRFCWSSMYLKVSMRAKFLKNMGATTGYSPVITLCSHKISIFNVTQHFFFQIQGWNRENHFKYWNKHGLKICIFFFLAKTEWFQSVVWAIHYHFGHCPQIL
jgi:hypothetical protein